MRMDENDEDSPITFTCLTCDLWVNELRHLEKAIMAHYYNNQIETCGKLCPLSIIILTMYKKCKVYTIYKCVQSWKWCKNGRQMKNEGEKWNNCHSFSNTDSSIFWAVSASAWYPFEHVLAPSFEFLARQGIQTQLRRSSKRWRKRRKSCQTHTENFL